MRLPILVYGVLYVVVEMVGHQLETLGWDRVTPLSVASALVDAFLAIVLAIAAVVALDLGRRRWGPAWHAWREGRLLPDDGPDEPIEVVSWRPDPLSPLRAIGAPVPTGSGTYGPPRTGPRYPEDPGRLL